MRQSTNYQSLQQTTTDLPSIHQQKKLENVTDPTPEQLKEMDKSLKRLIVNTGSLIPNKISEADKSQRLPKLNKIVERVVKNVGNNEKTLIVCPGKPGRLFSSSQVIMTQLLEQKKVHYICLKSTRQGWIRRAMQGLERMLPSSFQSTLETTFETINRELKTSIRLTQSRHSG